MAPLDLSTVGALPAALLFGLIGFGFGFVLEMTGFGDTRKLAAQFYFKDMTVLKTMFTAIVVAAVLIFAASSFGLLDLSRVWVNPTHLWPGIAGGLIMGVGFVVGGFCPGTSLVAVATGKLDGMAFVAGALVGVGLFGETVSQIQPFFLSGDLGRFTLPDWLGLPTGPVLVLVVAMALLLFVGAEVLERRNRNAAVADAPKARALPRFRRGGAAVLALVALLVAIHGQPDAATRLARNAKLGRLVAERGIFVDPAEVVALRKDLALHVEILDLRDESAFNLFHLARAGRVDERQLVERTFLRPLQEAEPNTVIFLVGQDEPQAFSAWRELRTRGVVNTYVIEGGMDHWLDRYPVPSCVATRAAGKSWSFRYATGESLPSAAPELAASRRFKVPCSDAPARDGSPKTTEHEIRWPDYPFTKHVKLQLKTLVKGGCG